MRSACSFALSYTVCASLYAFVTVSRCALASSSCDSALSDISCKLSDNAAICFLVITASIDSLSSPYF